MPSRSFRDAAKRRTRNPAARITPGSGCRVRRLRGRPGMTGSGFRFDCQTARPRFRGHGGKSQRSALRILCRGPGKAGLPVPLAKCEGAWSTARRNHVILRALGAACVRCKTHAPRGAPQAAFLSPAPCFRGAKLRASRARIGAASAIPSSPHRPAIQEQPVIVPADDWPGPPGSAVTSRSGGGRHPAPSSRRLMMTPLDEQDAGNIRPPERPGITFFWGVQLNYFSTSTTFLQV